jgi:hypothetical protein
VPVGGGGLISGVAYAVQKLNPNVKVYGVQAENAGSMARSVHEGHPVTLDTVATFADGIAVKTPGDITYEVTRQYVDDVVTVSEDEIATAILALMERQKLVADGARAPSAWRRGAVQQAAHNRQKKGGLPGFQGGKHRCKHSLPGSSPAGWSPAAENETLAGPIALDGPPRPLVWGASAPSYPGAAPTWSASTTSGRTPTWPSPAATCISAWRREILSRSARSSRR